MKKLCSLLTALVLAFALAAPAFADVIWEPDNHFYEKHASECQLLQRSFYINGENGYVNLLADPDSAAVNLQLKNGERVYVYWQYLDWGYVEIGDDGGWVKLSELALIYDYLSFSSEYADSIMPYDPALCQPLLDSWDGTTLVKWPYPGADQPSHVWDTAEDAIAMLKVEGDTYFHHIFRDEEGLIWAFCSYLWGDRNFWVCLNAPAGRDDALVQEGLVEMPVREVEQPELIPAADPELNPEVEPEPAPAVKPELATAVEPEPPTASYLLPAILVIVVVALTVIYLLLLRKKRNAKK